MNDKFLFREGNSIGRYKVKAQLGYGGMGQVYKCEYPQNRLVAVKTPTKYQEKESCDRFQSEVCSIRSFNHPNITEFIDSGLHIDVKDGAQREIPFLVMNYIEGQNLGFRIKTCKDNGVLSNCYTSHLMILEKIACAVDYLHDNGGIHRDLKPANIMINFKNKKPYLIDFGILKSQEKDAEPSSGSEIATLLYSSPEICLGKRVDRHTDQFSFAVLAIELLTGVHCFAGDNHGNICSKIIYGQPNIPKLNEHHVDNSLFTRVLSRALKNNPEDRYSCISEFISELKLAFCVEKMETCCIASTIELGNEIYGSCSKTEPLPKNDINENEAQTVPNEAQTVPNEAQTVLNEAQTVPNESKLSEGRVSKEQNVESSNIDLSMKQVLLLLTAALLIFASGIGSAYYFPVLRDNSMLIMNYGKTRDVREDKIRGGYGLDGSNSHSENNLDMEYAGKEEDLCPLICFWK